VLLVEDNEVNLELSRILLQLEGCEVTPATDGSKGVAAFRNGTFDMVFMDCQMPEMDGFEATAAIRAIEAGSSRRTPIIAVTASAIEGDRERCLRAGMDDYLAKPVSRHAIQTMLARWRNDKTPSSEEPAAEAGQYVPGNEATLSEAVLAELRELENEADGGLVQRLMSSFLHSSPGLLDDLRRGGAAREAGAIRAAAHTLKSASRVIGALTLSARCATLEALSHEGCSDEVLALVEEVIAEYEAIRPAVEAQLAGAAELATDG
jgi:CheY-like chemotaxis protein/HPt (histidine-containing phosphotransfer) domain-containing protein